MTESQDLDQAIWGLQPIATPSHATAVAGCNCGGFQIHRMDCSLHDLPGDVQEAAFADARQRLQGWTDMINGRLKAAPWA